MMLSFSQKGLNKAFAASTFLPKERSNPALIDHSRKKRISKGSGTTLDDVNQLMKQFSQMNKMMRMMQTMGSDKMMQMMQNAKK